MTGSQKYGKLLINNCSRSKQWDNIHVNLIGPWNVEILMDNRIKKLHIITALTYIKSTTQCPEFTPTRHNTSFHAAKLFDTSLLCY